MAVPIAMPATAPLETPFEEELLLLERVGEVVAETRDAVSVVEGSEVRVVDDARDVTSTIVVEDGIGAGSENDVGPGLNGILPLEVGCIISEELSEGDAGSGRRVQKTPSGLVTHDEDGITTTKSKNFQTSKVPCKKEE